MNASEREPVQVYEAANSIEAAMVLQKLDEAGIEARIASRAVESLAGEVPFQLAVVPIWVDRSDAERARQVINKLPPRR